MVFLSLRPSAMASLPAQTTMAAKIFKLEDIKATPLSASSEGEILPVMPPPYQLQLPAPQGSKAVERPLSPAFPVASIWTQCSPT